MAGSVRVDGLDHRFGSEAERRYLEDPEFKALVDLMESYADRLALTPWELRQAAYVAAMRRELRSNQMVFPVPLARSTPGCTFHTCSGMPIVRHGDHITIRTATNDMHCARCGETRQLELPLKLNEFNRRCAAFVAQHRGCDERVPMAPVESGGRGWG